MLSIQNEWNEDEEWWTAEENDDHDEELRQMISNQTEDLNKREYVKSLMLKYD